jgi:hypothetical protein
MNKYSFEITHSKDCSESRIKFLFRVFFALIGQFSPVKVYLWPVFRKILGSQAAFETTSESQAVIAKPKQAP